MNRVYAMSITEDDHHIFINEVHNYPSYSYDKWLQFRAKELDEWRDEGLEVIEIDVTPDDFARYCRDTGARRDLSTLRAVAAAKGTGKFK
ncbi:MAG: hypothetical protein WBA60_09770 [Methylovirgula sp.]